MKEDTRPAYGAWAPGKYYNRCTECGCQFAGDKRATNCADCAYAAKPMKIIETSRTVIENKLLAALNDDSSKVAALLTEQDVSDLIHGLEGYMETRTAGVPPTDGTQFMRILSLHTDLKTLRETAFNR